MVSIQACVQLVDQAGAWKRIKESPDAAAIAQRAEVRATEIRIEGQPGIVKAIDTTEGRKREESVLR